DAIWLFPARPGVGCPVLRQAAECGIDENDAGIRLETLHQAESEGVRVGHLVHGAARAAKTCSRAACGSGAGLASAKRAAVSTAAPTSRSHAVPSPRVLAPSSASQR